MNKYIQHFDVFGYFGHFLQFFQSRWRFKIWNETSWGLLLFGCSSAFLQVGDKKVSHLFRCETGLINKSAKGTGQPEPNPLWVRPESKIFAHLIYGSGLDYVIESPACPSPIHWKGSLHWPGTKGLFQAWAGYGPVFLKVGWAWACLSLADRPWTPSHLFHTDR